MDCSICYEAITETTGKTSLGCSHTFHFRCIVKWFDSQVENDIKESCPCCRHEATEHEKLPEPIPEEESMESDEDREERIAQDAREERAYAKFVWLRATKSREDLEDYAASKIAAMMRGHWAYLWYSETSYSLRVFKAKQQIVKRVAEDLKEAADDMVASKYTLQFYRKSIRMTRIEFINYAAKKIQKIWRAFYAKRPNLRVTWERTGESWTRLVQIMPASYFYDDPVLWDPSRALPPQSLAFQMARSATAIQSLWRGYSVRSAALQTPRKRQRVN
jgi:hypothetical protein